MRADVFPDQNRVFVDFLDERYLLTIEEWKQLEETFPPDKVFYHQEEEYGHNQ